MSKLLKYAAMIVGAVVVALTLAGCGPSDYRGTDAQDHAYGEYSQRMDAEQAEQAEYEQNLFDQGYRHGSEDAYDEGWDAGFDAGWDAAVEEYGLY